MSDLAAEMITMSSVAQSMAQGLMEEEVAETILLGIAARGETTEDLVSFTRSFADAAVKVRTRHPVVLDMCGTGGAGFRTFNVSTLAAIVASSVGVAVAKHGNRSTNGTCGSADLMEAMGYDLNPDMDRTEKMLDEVYFTFLFAPNFHPAMRSIAPVRKRIGKRTIFNLLGPLLNPVEARKRQLIGVPDPRLLDVVADALVTLEVERAWVVHGEPGMDEVSTLGSTEVVEVSNGEKRRFRIDPREYGIESASREEVSELPPALAGRMARRVLDHEEPHRSDMVALNAACGLYVYAKVPSLAQGLDLARKAMTSGQATLQLERILRLGGERE